MPRRSESIAEIALVGDLSEHQADWCDKLLEVAPGGSCVLYFDSPGGSPYSAMALANLLLLRGLDAVGIVVGECSSAALLPFAACRRRLVTAHSTLLFHHMKWQSEENVGLVEAAQWAKHFGELEQKMDCWLVELLGADPQLIAQWIDSGRYVPGPELAAAGLAELISPAALPWLMPRKR